MRPQFYGFNEATRQLRVLVPPVWPVRVRRVKMPDLGDCTMVSKPKSSDTPYYQIRVNRELSEASQVLVLIHEWAHALSWTTDSHRVRAHGPEWGLACSRIWQALVED